MRVHLASQPFPTRREDLLVTAAPDADVYKADGAVLQPIALGDLVVGEKLRVEGRVDYSSGTAVYLGKRLVMRDTSGHDRALPFRGQVTAVDAAAGTLTATLDKVTRALSPYYQGTCAFRVAPDARLWVMKNGWRRRSP